ncbi:MAG: deoxyribodipyrimidine photo-lyase [Bacteriovoracaceae bacterium]|nr:deoxyribodipyrimidine photo-lyase [Bacteriovoracaceae bacterium]
MKRALTWIRRDLRLHDHHALSESLKSADETIVVFIFDETILEKLHNKNDLRVTFIMQSLKEIETTLAKLGSSLLVRFGNPVTLIPQIVDEYKIEGVFFNRDYEPYAKLRDSEVTKRLRAKDVGVASYKDSVFYEKNEVLNGSGEIYKVFTPYKNKWLEKFHAQEDTASEYFISNKKFYQYKNPKNVLDTDWFYEIGFIETPGVLIGGSKEALKLLTQFRQYISNYKEARDVPALEQTSNLSTYIRMGNLSVRDMIRLSIEKKNPGYETWLSEIIWRDFYHMILDAYPRIENNSFKPQYDAIKWIGKKEDFEKWCDGQTGFPIVDSAMRCLNATGLMHNRLRMIVASFLTKTLLINWRLGEKYFAEKLYDYDMAANNGGWQWSASTGVDAQPYFRIFNPYSQSEKFDSEGLFIRRWCPELDGISNKKIHAPQEMDMFEQAQSGCVVGKDYPYPIVDYKSQRDKALKMYKEIR